MKTLAIALFFVLAHEHLDLALKNLVDERDAMVQMRDGDGSQQLTTTGDSGNGLGISGFPGLIVIQRKGP